MWQTKGLREAVFGSVAMIIVTGWFVGCVANKRVGAEWPLKWKRQRRDAAIRSEWTPGAEARGEEVGRRGRMGLSGAGYRQSQPNRRKPIILDRYALSSRQ